MTSADAALWLQLAWRVAHAPAVARVQVHVAAPADADRRVCVAIDGPLFYRSYELPMQGAAGPKTWTATEIAGLPAGDYEIRAAVGWGDCQRIFHARARATVRVLVE